MKNLQEIISSEPVFLNNWKNEIEVFLDFEEIYMSYAEFKYENSEWATERKNKMRELLNTKYKNINILFATYGVDGYEGDAFVLFEENGKLYEVSGSHCSCYGLEEQWEPEEVMLEELENRLFNGSFGEGWNEDNQFKKELCEFLGVEYKIIKN